MSEIELKQNNDKSKAFDMLRQAMHETLPDMGQGFYGFLPNQVGLMVERHKQLCKEHGIDPETFEEITGTAAEARDERH
jgi:hypothetical protein